MKNVILIPLVATGALLGCQESQNTHQKAVESVQQQKLVAWAGQYQGTTPCMGCTSRCTDCLGMAVDLTLNPDMTYHLVRESLSGHNQVENLRGVLRFRDAEQTQLELLNVATRNLMVVDTLHHVLEIREDTTGNAYIAADDFLLEQPTKTS